MFYTLLTTAAPSGLPQSRAETFMYYALIMTSVVMFGFQFLLNKVYVTRKGSGLRETLEFQLGFSAFGVLLMAVIYIVRNGLAAPAGLGWFTLAMSFLTALNSALYSIFSLKALGKINLSLFSVFVMLGGMLLPFFLGVAFFNEGMTLGKVISVILIIAALAVTVQRGSGKSGVGYYIGIFILNGMTGVISKLYQAGNFPKTDEPTFMMFSAMFGIVISLAALVITGCWKLSGTGARNAAAMPDDNSKTKTGIAAQSDDNDKAKTGIAAQTEDNGKAKTDIAASISMFGCGALYYAGNLILLISLSHVPASAQYPLVTGGVMVISTLLCYFTKDKPTWRELLSVAFSMLGIFAMILI